MNIVRFHLKYLTIATGSQRSYLEIPTEIFCHQMQTIRVHLCSTVDLLTLQLDI